MQYRHLGHTGLKVSELGFGCGSIGGLLVRGEYPKMRRAVARALELGISYFDTASLYGDGQSEVNLGAVLRELRADPIVGTKVRLVPADMGRIEETAIASVEGSLRRLGRERVDLIQLHNHFGAHGQAQGASVTTRDVESVLRAFQSVERQGKVRFWGITGLGETALLHQAVAGGGFHTVQAVYNLLNPSTGTQVPAGFPYQDYRQLIDRAAGKQMGVIVIRALAGGALSGTPDRHPVAARSVAPIATERDYAADVARARRFAFLVENGTVSSLVEAAIRFAISKPEVSTALVGISSLEQLEQAVACANRGPLPAEALGRLHGG
ncbi:MAG: aldo/keto reductase [Candidatus Methylomirabilota bacterium]|jgi:aryl-alcohol dehydrogenase-like predicted oxidoreductase